MVGCLASRRTDSVVVRTVHGLPERGAPGGRRLTAYALLENALARFFVRGTAFVSHDLWRCSGSPRLSRTLRVIWNGLEYATEVPRRSLAGRFRIGIVGRITTVKGHDIAIAAISRLRSESSVVLYVIGDGPLRTELETLCVRLGVQEKVVFTGFQEAMDTWYASLDALLMPSRHEGLPYALIEAMGAGLPIVASDVGGIREVLTDGETGLIVPPEDCAALARAIETLAASPELRQRLGHSASRFARAHLSAAQMTSAYEELYVAALAG